LYVYRSPPSLTKILEIA
jgi:hypothetical protein